MADDLDCPHCDEPMEHRTSLVGDEHYDCDNKEKCDGFFFIQTDRSDDK